GMTFLECVIISLECDTAPGVKHACRGAQSTETVLSLPTPVLFHCHCRRWSGWQGMGWFNCCHRAVTCHGVRNEGIQETLGMSQLHIYSDVLEPGQAPEPAEMATSPDRIAQLLEHVGVLFEQWEKVDLIDHESAQDEIIEAYRKPVDQLMQRHGLEAVEVISIYPDHPKKD